MECHASVWLLALSLSLLISSSCGLSVDAVFNQQGVNGTVTFNQTGQGTMVSITVQLQGLGMTPEPILWAIHTFPFPPSASYPCQSAIGPPYHNISDVELLSVQEKQTFITGNITLLGNNSIIGRSLLIRLNNSSVCANIGYASADTILWAPFRSENIAIGNVFLRQHANQSFASIYVTLTTKAPSLPWSILSEASECSNSSDIYNPTGMDGEGCSRSNWLQCAIGDLSGRNGELVVEGGAVEQLVTDPDLALGAVTGLTLALGGEGAVSCATIQPYPPLQVVAEAGPVRVELTQRSPLEATRVVVTGQEGVEYAIHTLPPGASCSNTGEIFDPRRVGARVQGSTLDSYRFGDLSGKSRGSSMYFDPYLPLSGLDSVVGRTLVVTRANLVSECGLLQYAGEVVQMVAVLVMEGFSGTITFTQPAGNPLVDTVITIETNISAEVELFSSTVPASTSMASSTPSMAASSPVMRASSTQPGMASPAPSPAPSPSSAVTPPLSDSPSSSLVMTTDLETSLASFLYPFPFSASPFTTFTSPFPSPSITPLPSPSITPLPSPSLTPLPLPSSTPLMPGGSGLMESDILMPLESSVVMGGGGKRRRRREAATAAQFSWSLRQWDGNALPDDCSQLSIIGSSNGSCLPSDPLSCAAGDLTGKHGPIPFGEFTAVIHDPYLPLTGPNGVISAVLLVQPANGVGPSVCVVVTMTTSATPTPTSLPTPATGGPTLSSRTLTSSMQSSIVPSSPPRSSTGNDNIVLIGAVVGGVIGAALLLTVLLLLVCLCVRRLRTHQVDLSKQGKTRNDMELGHIIPHVEPQIGSDQYRAVFSYQPQTPGSDDLVLEKGEWVTLLEAPYGGDWWRGQATASEGWFPKSHVEYVDRKAERKMAEEDNFKLAAAAIVAASSSFSKRHGSLSTSKIRDTHSPSTNRKRSTTTISKADINSTPVMTAKFDVSSALDSVVIENERHMSVSTASTSRPNTPRSLGGSDVITNHATMEAGNSQGSSDVEAGMKLEPYLAKYNYAGGMEIELPLRKGEIVSVIEKAASGWWQGVCGGRVGWFPASYVKPATMERREEQEGEKEGSMAPLDMEESLRSEIVEATECRAIHTFSSGQEGDLQFVEGDSVLVYWAHSNGWWYGSSGSRQGWFPGTYVEPSIEVSETGSAAPSPLPLSEGTGAEGRPLDNEVTAAAAAFNEMSPSRKGPRKWSFKRNKSDGELLLPTEVKGEIGAYKNKKRQQSRPQRKAPPPPLKESPPSDAKPPSTPPLSLSPLLTTTLATPPSHQTPPTVSEHTFTATRKREDAVLQQPSAKPRKRRTTVSAIDPHKPRRLPPPPPASLATPQTPPITTGQPPATADAVAEDVANKSPPSWGTTPIPLPRQRVRVQRVQRPATRLIPPPPNVPLPPPPTRTPASSPAALTGAARPPQAAVTRPSTEGNAAKETAQAVAEASSPREPTKPDVEPVIKPAKPDVETVIKPVKPDVEPVIKPAKPDVKPVIKPAKPDVAVEKEEAGVPGEVKKTSKPAKPKPPIKPKPAHLSKRLSEPSLSYARRNRASLPAAQGSPKPPPPARTSSLLLHSKPPSLAEPSLTTIADSREETDSGPNRGHTPNLQDTAEAVRNLRSPPPAHPPPPRPHTANSDTVQKQRSNPPSFPPPQRPDAQKEAGPGEVSRSSSLKARGTQLVRSLKKMVQRSDSKGGELERRSPDQGREGAEVIHNLQTESPVPQKRQTYGMVTPSRPPPPKAQLSPTANSKKLPVAKAAPLSPMPDSTHSHTHSSLSATAASSSSPAHSAGSSHSTSPPPPSNFYRAMSDYAAQLPSELTLHRGDILIEIDRPTPSMHYGMLDDGTTGLFPDSAVEPLITPSSKSS